MPFVQMTPTNEPSQNAMLPLIEKVIESRTNQFYWQKINITVKVFPIISFKLIIIEDFNEIALDSS